MKGRGKEPSFPQAAPFSKTVASTSRKSRPRHAPTPPSLDKSATPCAFPPDFLSVARLVCWCLFDRHIRDT
ncbi:hypothetical protein DMY87_20275 [Rhizobium wuzhouense]|uniref:Uncharacterized protein n=1 Tax=Rhizobium wuzhouense TaxID=1986026 RepID=A0ABX5NQK8_9HYPH|nr:hypothetical protein DMY87_20275 [Rhizobium wuzhouense]